MYKFEFSNALLKKYASNVDLFSQILSSVFLYFRFLHFGSDMYWNNSELYCSWPSQFIQAPVLEFDRRFECPFIQKPSFIWDLKVLDEGKEKSESIL